MFGMSEKLKQNRGESLQPRPVPLVTGGPSTGLADGLRDRKTFRKASMIATDRIMADPGQPRQTFPDETIERLAESIRHRGQLVPILVRWSKDADCFIVIDGERRYRAAKRAGLPELACVVESEADPATLLEIQLVTNALREDVAPMEQAQAWRRLMESQNLTHAQLAAKLGYDRSTVTRTVGLTEASSEIQEAVNAGEIRPQTAYELSRVADPVEQAELLTKAKAGQIRRDDLKGRGKATTSNASKSKPKGKSKLSTMKTWKPGNGLIITAERAKGLDLATLAATFRTLADQIEAVTTSA